ncbi:C40 family peptidase [Streptacidiphilus griseoplanus]|uniref:C40 family peptidase n=1 Tax=Peterkaempfera griseoplana TaxID=66896 RepID=UPI0007C6514B|nr:NlpC/P60 family protein [Peterkaempfera griseoplana]
MAVAQQQTGGRGVAPARPWVRAALRCGAVLAVAALALPATVQAAWAAPDPAAVGAATPADPLAKAKATLGPLLDQLHDLYQKAEEATERYNDASDQLRQHTALVAELQRRVDEKQTQVDAGTELAAELASAQYRNGSLSGYAQLLLADSPYEALDRGQALQRAGDAQAQLLDALKADQSALDALKTQAEENLKTVQLLTRKQQTARDGVKKQLDAVEQAVASLTGAQRAELEKLEKQEADQAQLAFLATGVLGKGERAPSKAGRKALLYAFQQLGKPYVWGGSGPDVFDCSGLTSQAWLHAGLPIPRTSQQQWAQLQHIPLNQLRPGDLVVYFSGATHVAMYIGAGLIIQAPRPGAFVKVSPMGGMPILGAVRPDPSAPGDGGKWKLPEVPGGTDTTTPILGVDIHDGGKPKPYKPAPPAKPADPTHQPSSAPGSPAGGSSGTPSGSPSGSAPASGSPSPSSSDPSSSSGPSPSGSASASPTGSASDPASASPSDSASGSAAPSDSAASLTPDSSALLAGLPTELG